VTDSNFLHDGPTPEQVLSALDRTGFILEYRVAQKLREAAFTTYLNHPFTDPETGKLRELDILAEFDHRIDIGQVRVFITLNVLVECKKYEDPLVVIGEDRRVIFHNDDPLIPFDPLLFDFPNRPMESYGGLPGLLDLWKLPSHVTSGFIGSQLLKMRRSNGKWQADNNSVYDSIVYPLKKAVEAERAEMQGNDNDPDYDDSSRRLTPTIHYNFPVLVTYGDVYAVNVTSDETPSVTRVNWSPLVRQFEKHPFLMDVVGFSHIDDYLKQRVFPTLEDAKRVLTPLVNVFNPEWLVKEYGEPSDSKFDEWLTEFRANGDRKGNAETGSSQ
jgi:hypothetical protein